MPLKSINQSFYEANLAIIISKYFIATVILCFLSISGFLDSSTDDKDIAPGTKMELPFWLAHALCSQKRRIVSVELPKAYRESYREVMKADANVVNLYKLGPYYYNFGMKLQCFSFPEIDDVSMSLLSVSNKITPFFLSEYTQKTFLMSYG